jgi:GTP-binding protein
VLIHVVDLGAPDPERDFGIIRDELEARDPRLLDKTTLVVANKLDLPGAAEALPEFRAARKRDGLEVAAISASDGDGIPQLLAALARLLPDADELAQPGEPAGVVVHRPEGDRSGYSVDRDTDDVLRVRGRKLERLVAMTDFENEESAERFQRELARLGVERALMRAGVQVGDTVRIGGHELEWCGEAWR